MNGIANNHQQWFKPKVSVNIITKNRQYLLRKAVESVLKQSLDDFKIELLIVNDGSIDTTGQLSEGMYNAFREKPRNDVIFSYRINNSNLGITKSRQEALEASNGEYIAILDDDDEWTDPDKLKKQVEFLDQHQDSVIVGGGIIVESRSKKQEVRVRPETDRQIKNWMLIKNPFFTSTVMFRRGAAIKAGGFKKDEFDVAEDYDLWLRMGLLGKMHNFQEAFTLYSVPNYNNERFKQFLTKQLKLVNKYKQSYPYVFFAKKILAIRLWLLSNQGLKIKD